MSGGDSSAALGLGSCVLISALQAKPQHNGQHGVVEDVPDGSGRLIVRLEGTDTSLSLTLSLAEAIDPTGAVPS